MSPSPASDAPVPGELVLETRDSPRSSAASWRSTACRPQGPARLDPRPDRAERRRQDHRLQPAHQVPAGHRGAPSSTGARTSPGCRPAEVARRGVVRSFQISAVFPNLTVARERARRAAAAARHLLPLLDARRGACRSSTTGRGSCSPTWTSRTCRDAVAGGAALRPQAGAGARHHAGARARAAAARRAHRRGWGTRTSGGSSSSSGGWPRGAPSSWWSTTSRWSPTSADTITVLARGTRPRRGHLRGGLRPTPRSSRPTSGCAA